MTIEVRPIQPGDMEYVRANPYQESVRDYPDLQAPADSFTCVFDGEIVAVGGLNIFWSGVGEAWIILTKSARKEGVFGIIAFHAIRRKLEELIADNNIRRCEAQARADFDKANKFINALGFKFECVRRRYCPDGSDMNLYSQVKQ